MAGSPASRPYGYMNGIALTVLLSQLPIGSTRTRSWWRVGALAIGLMLLFFPNLV